MASTDLRVPTEVLRFLFSVDRFHGFRSAQADRLLRIMAKTKKKSNGEGPRKKLVAEGPVLALKMDSKTAEPIEVKPASETSESSWQTPCTISGLGAGLSGGALGYAFGFGKE